MKSVRLSASAAIRDISVRNAAERHLAEMEGRYRGLLEAAPDAMVVVNEAGDIVLLNLQAEKQFDYRRDELLGQKVTNIIPEGFAERLVADGLRSPAEALAQQIGTGIELTGRRKDGTQFPMEIMLSPLESEEGVLVTTAIRDISVRKALEQLSQHDGLTNLANRRFFDVYLTGQIAVARRHRRTLSLVMLDVDHFKAYNDHYGHQAGDACLKQIAAALFSCCRRPADLVARYGGEEFTMVLPDTELGGAALIAEAAREAVAKLKIPNEHAASGPYVSISGGVAVLLRDADISAQQLIAAADQTLYRAKQLGRNRMVSVEPEPALELT